MAMFGANILLLAIILSPGAITGCAQQQTSNLQSLNENRFVPAQT
jgi:hypothetical protein